MPPRSVRRKRMPEFGAAGLSERVTFLPEWRPIPAQDVDRRSVRCRSMSLPCSLGAGPAHREQTECRQTAVTVKRKHALYIHIITRIFISHKRPSKFKFVVSQPHGLGA